MGRKTPWGHYSSSESDLEIKVQPRNSGPTSEEHDPRLYSRPSPSIPPPNYNPSNKKWLPWLVPVVIIVNVVLFIFVMYTNDCPHNNENCFGTDLFGRFSFQDFHENPLLGPSTTTYVNKYPFSTLIEICLTIN